MSTSPDDIAARLQLAVTIAREAGDVTLRYFRREDLYVDRKADDSPVTVADREAEQHLRSRILATFADDGIVGEALGQVEGRSGFRWILAPIDVRGAGIVRGGVSPGGPGCPSVHGLSKGCF